MHNGMSTVSIALMALLLVVILVLFASGNITQAPEGGINIRIGP